MAELRKANERLGLEPMNCTLQQTFNLTDAIAVEQRQQFVERLEVVEPAKGDLAAFLGLLVTDVAGAAGGWRDLENSLSWFQQLDTLCQQIPEVAGVIEPYLAS